MKRTLLILLVGFNIIWIAPCTSSCNVNGPIMDCSNQNMEDCPAANPNIKELIMDNNRLTDLNRGGCADWTHLQVLRISNNGLREFINFTLFPHLTEINASHNLFQSANIVVEELVLVDLSHNRLTEVSVDNALSLRILILAHNTMDPSTFDDLFKDQLLPFLETIDLSYNHFSTVPNIFMSFFPSSLTHVNLAGNNISTIFFTIFTYTNHRPVYLNLSHNSISTMVLTQPPSLAYLDLSHNKLQSIDPSILSLLIPVPRIDLSHNPFKCSCQYLPPFIGWMKSNPDTFTNKQSTNCLSSDGANIFSLSCDSIKSSSPRWWPIALALIITVLIITAGVLYGILRRRRMYTELEIENNRFISIFPSIFTDCVRPHDNDQTSSNPELAIPNQHLEFDEKLVILCSYKNKRWVSQEIVPSLRMNIQVVDSSVNQIPPSEFVLIIVNGDRCLKDSNLIKNVTLVLQSCEILEVRLLLCNRPTTDILKQQNCVSNFINNSVLNNTYFEYDRANPRPCIDSLQAWLNLDV